MMNFSEDFLDELTSRNDIVDVVSSYVNLTKHSGANLFGLCPFHGEKTPSFAVNRDKQFYHCFGCGRGGSVIRFIMDIENLSFHDAVEFLAKRAGMEMPEEEEEDPSREKRGQILALNREAARFFYSQLIAPEGTPGREYVYKRGIVSMVKPFGLGFAPDSWDTLTTAMQKKGFTEELLVEAGLARKGKKGHVYDYFRNRLIFPVIDVRGNIIGFSGRILGEGEPKYLNSPDTLVYSKSRSLFALNLAKKSKSGYILLVEGNIDVVSLHQAGFDSAVASLGTSLTTEQARLISQYTSQVILAYDSDKAGQKATQRAIDIFQHLDLKISVLKVPGAKDPDEFIQANGPEKFQQLIDQSGNQIEYRLEQAAAQFDLSTDDGKVNYLKEAAKIIAAMPGALEREIYGMRVAEKTNVSKESFRLEVERVRRMNDARNKKRRERAATAALQAAQPMAKSLHYSNVGSAKAEEGVMNLLCRFPDQFHNLDLKKEEFSVPELGKLYDLVVEKIRQGSSISVAVLGQMLSDDEMKLLTGILEQDTVSASEAGRAMQDYLKKIREGKKKEIGEQDLRSYAEKLRQTKGYGG